MKDISSPQGEGSAPAEPHSNGHANGNGKRPVKLSTGRTIKATPPEIIKREQADALVLHNTVAMAAVDDAVKRLQEHIGDINPFRGALPEELNGLVGLRDTVNSITKLVTDYLEKEKPATGARHHMHIARHKGNPPELHKLLEELDAKCTAFSDTLSNVRRAGNANELLTPVRDFQTAYHAYTQYEKTHALFHLTNGNGNGHGRNS